MNRLRFKLYMLIIPLVVMVVLTSGFLSSLESRKAMIRAANRHLAYKAEQLRDYAFSEWSMIEKLNLSGLNEYRVAAEKSLRSYGYTLLRSNTEQILIFDSQGYLLHRLTLQLPSRENEEMTERATATLLPVGWYSGTLLGEKRVGVVFSFEPFGWTIAITELHSQFFSDTQEILRIHLIILLSAILVMSFIITLYVRHIVRPAEQLAGTIEKIALTHNMAHRAEIEFDDEIGFIAERFNNMISALQNSHDQLERTSLAEITSRKKAFQSEIETLHLLGLISDFRDQNTGDHQERIGSLTKLFSLLLGQGLYQQELIMNSSRLHDIGKIAIPDAILLKPGKLTVEEFDVIKTHTVLGKDLLEGSHSENLIEGAIIAYTHHERWDGSGYPQGLSGEAIPLSGRIVSIVDVFDALISERPYKKMWTKEDALAYIVAQSGTQFDPVLVDHFEKNFSAFCELL